MLIRESELNQNYGLTFTGDRPWIEFELLERAIMESEARKQDAEVSKQFATEPIQTGTVMTSEGFEVPTFKI